MLGSKLWNSWIFLIALKSILLSTRLNTVNLKVNLWLKFIIVLSFYSFPPYEPIDQSISEYCTAHQGYTSKQDRNIQGSQPNGPVNTFLQRLSTLRKPQYKEKRRTKFTQVYLHFQEQHGQVGIRFAFFFFQFRPFLKSLPNVYSCLASVGHFPFSLLLFLRYWVSLYLFSRLIHDECSNPFATCVYIQPVPCLWVCNAVKQFVTLQDLRLLREFAAGRRQKQFLCMHR